MAAGELIARNVRRFRQERQLSVGELGRRAGLAKQTVAGLEAGAGNPTVETMERLADALGVSVRALITEMGTEVLALPAAEAEWRVIGPARLRHLGQVYGSGYVTSAVVHLDRAAGPSQHSAGGRGSLRHCYVLSGSVRLGPDGHVVVARAGDFVRFPAEAPHVFEAIGATAEVLVITTAPQLTMTPGESLF